MNKSTIQIEIKNCDHPITVVFSPRKQKGIGLSISKATGEIKCTAPINTSINKIQTILAKHTQWINQKRNNIIRCINGEIKPKYIQGSQIYDKTIQAPNCICPVPVFYSARKKRIGLSANKVTGEIRCIVPLHASTQQIEQMISNNITWINKQAHKLRTTTNSFTQEFITGAQIPYLGQYLVLSINTATQPTVIKDNQQLQIYLPPQDLHQEDAARNLVFGWLGKQAWQIILPKVEHFARLIAVTPKQTIIKSMRDWGSCIKTKGKISFNWTVIAYPQEVIDYLVVHELCHLHEPNHSARFWAHVQKQIPNWQALRKQMNLNPPIDAFLGRSRFTFSPQKPSNLTP